MKLLLKRLMSLVPTPLPVGMTEFEEWSNSIIELSGNYADTDSMKFAIASMVIHLGPQTSHISKNHFVRSLRKTAANQIASQVFIDVKERQKQKELAAKEAAASNEENSQKETGSSPA